MEEFLTRLKAHKLVQWTLGYLAVSFALLPVLDIVAARFGWSQTAVRCMIIALGTGFFMMLVIAWYHGEHGARRITRTEHAILSTLLVLGGLAMWRIGPSAPKPDVENADAAIHAIAAPKTITSEPITALASIPTKSVAVLPFENLSTDKGNAYFADGMQDLILTKLADIGDLKVISRTSTLQYGSHPEDLKTIGQQLGVATLLEGSVQKAGNQVLINVQLIDAKTDTHIWAQSYQRTLDNIFGVEGEVAEKVASALNAKLTASESAAVAKVPTRNKQALDAFMRGSYYLNHETSSLNVTELERAVALLEQATRLDPGFSSAFSDLSLAYQHLGGHNSQAEAAARRALALDPGNPDAHRMVAYTLMHAGKYEEALQQAGEAVQLAPQSAWMNNGLGNVYASAGQLDKAAASYRRALELDPKANIIRINLASLLTSQHHYVDARDLLFAATVRDPSSILAAIQLASVQELGWGDLAAARQVLQGVTTPVATSGALSDAWYWINLYARDYPAALAVIQHAPSSWFQQQGYPLALYQAQVYRAQGNTRQAQLAFTQAGAVAEAGVRSQPGNAAWYASLALARAGLDDTATAVTEAQRAVKLAGTSTTVNPFLPNLAAVYAWTGRIDAALKLLDELLQKPAGDVISAQMLKLDPTWDPIRNDPRFQPLLKKYFQPAPTSATSVGVDN